MRSKFQIAALLFTLSAACAAEVDEDDSSLELSHAIESLDGCPSHSATNSVHVQAGRAYSASRYVYFRRVTTYYARGTNESLGTSATTNQLLYEIGAASFSLSASRCPVANPPPSADAAATPTPGNADGGTAVVDARVPAADGSTPNGSSGCGVAPPGSGAGKTLVVDGTTRSYVLSLPSGYDRTRAYPLIFAFHGLGGSGSQAQLYFGLAQASQGQAILVYPDAAGSSRAWGVTGASATLDIAFFDALLRTLSSSLCVDQSKVFAAGHSMGGYFSNTLGCARGNTLRAIAPVAGGGPYVSCDNGKVAAWLMAASNDTVVSPSAGQASRDHWLRANGCSATTRPVGPSSCVAYDGCDAAHPVQWCLESTGGHNWPSYGGQAIWSFFKSF
jgi:poly(3-hydroxybutyrate) depolymerase